MKHKPPPQKSSKTEKVTNKRKTEMNINRPQHSPIKITTTLSLILILTTPALGQRGGSPTTRPAEEISIEFTEYQQFKQEAVIFFTDFIKPTDFMNKLKFTMTAEGQPFTNFAINSVSLSNSSNSIIVFLNITQPIKGGELIIEILDPNTFVAVDDSIKYKGKFITVGEIFENPGVRYEDDGLFDFTENATGLVYSTIIPLFLLGFYRECLLIVITFQRYYFLIFVNEFKPPIYNLYLTELKAPQAGISLISWSEAEIKCQNLRKYNEFGVSCALMNNQGAVISVFAIIVVIKIIVSIINSFIMKSLIRKSRLEFQKKTFSKKGFRRMRSLAFERSAKTLFEEQTEANQNINSINIISLIDKYFSKNFIFYFLRLVQVPVFVSLWVCMFRYREQSTAMIINFILSILLAWAFIGFTVYVLYSYMNYFAKVEDAKADFLDAISVERVRNFKRRDIVTGYMVDFFKAIVFVFFLDLGEMVYPIFILMTGYEIFVVVKMKERGWVHRIGMSFWHLAYIGNLGLLFYYQVREFNDDAMGKLMMYSTFGHIFGSVLIAFASVLLTIFGFVRFLWGRCFGKRDDAGKGQKAAGRAPTIGSANGGGQMIEMK